MATSSELVLRANALTLLDLRAGALLVVVVVEDLVAEDDDVAAAGAVVEEWFPPLLEEDLNAATAITGKWKKMRENDGVCGKWNRGRLVSSSNESQPAKLFVLFYCCVLISSEGVCALLD